jgi:phosphoenolpyruvate carboxykinase (GTP)
VMDKLVAVDAESWRQELPQIDEHYRFIGDTVPAPLREQLDNLEKRLAGG